MKIVLIEILNKEKGCANKDLAGGMGNRTWVGNSLRARIIEFIKARSVKIPPLNLAYIHAIFRQYNHEVSFARNMSYEEADLYIIRTSIFDYENEIKVAKEIRKSYTGKICFIGTFASVVPDIFLKYADLVVLGEPEQLMIEIAKTGVIPKGKVKSEFIKNLDDLPFPDWSIFPLHEYSYKPVITRKNMVTMLSSRGCPFSCGHYCPYPLGQGAIWRSRSVKNVVDEIEYLYNKFEVRAIDFRDPNFTLNKERAKQIAKEIIKRKLDIYWVCETHINVLDEKMLDLFYKAGLRHINVGIESVNTDVLTNSKRNTSDIETQKRIINYCEKIGISVATFYIFGALSDTKKTLIDTINFAKQLNTLVAQFAIFTPFPGTRFYDEIKNKISQKDWCSFNSYDLVFYHPNFKRSEILKLKEYAWVSYYFRWAYILKQVKARLKNVINNWSDRIYR